MKVIQYQEHHTICKEISLFLHGIKNDKTEHIDPNFQIKTLSSYFYVIKRILLLNLFLCINSLNLSFAKAYGSAM